VTLQIFEGAVVIPEMQHIVVQAKLAFTVAGSSQFAPQPAAVPPAACPAAPATKPAGAASRPVAARLAASGRPDGRLDPSAPRECLEDPFTELRVWTEAQDGIPAELWPYCTQCDCWTDLAHHHGKKHRASLANCDPSQAAPSYELVAVEQHDTSAQPAQIEEVIPPMDTEVIVEGNLSSLASCPGGMPSAWMWHGGMQQGLPWLPQTMQTQPVSAAVQEGYSWYPYAAFPQVEQMSEQMSQVPEQPHQVDGIEPRHLWTHAINSMPWELPQQGGTSSTVCRLEATNGTGSSTVPPWSSCATVSSGDIMSLRAGAPAPVEQKQEQQETSESPADLEETVILPKCRWTNNIASVAPQSDAAEPHERVAKISGGCIEV